MMMQKAAYGLVQAPLHWYRSVSGYLDLRGPDGTGQIGHSRPRR